MDAHVRRKTLPHDLPPWIDPAESEFFVTICCQQRGRNQLCLPGIGEALLASARIYYEQRKWYPSPLLLMPDHLHMLVSFGRDQDGAKIVRTWKHYTARRYKIDWQRDFFEHRLRAAESASEKYDYILSNPVRAELVNNATDWPHVWIPEIEVGTAVPRRPLLPSRKRVLIVNPPTECNADGEGPPSLPYNLKKGHSFQLVAPAQTDELFDAVHRYYTEDQIHLDETLVRPALVQLLSDFSLGRAFFLRDTTNHPVGYVVFTFGFDHEAGGRLATITDLFIEPTHRRRGLGRATLQFVADTSHALGIRGVELQHERHNLAGGELYRSFGFRDNGRVAMFLPLN